METPFESQRVYAEGTEKSTRRGWRRAGPWRSALVIARSPRRCNPDRDCFTACRAFGSQLRLAMTSGWLGDRTREASATPLLLLEHFGGGGADRRRNLLAAEHARHLLHPPRLVQQRHLRHRPSVLRHLGDRELPLRLLRDRREMRDAEYLVPVLAQMPEPLPHHLGGRAADPRIHFIEDQ